MGRAADAKIQAEAKALEVNALSISAKNNISATEDQNLVPARKISSEEYAKVQALEQTDRLHAKNVSESHEEGEIQRCNKSKIIVEKKSTIDTNIEVKVIPANGAKRKEESLFC